MTFREAARSGLTKYAVFTGRAGRSEFWYFVLFGALVGVVANVVDNIVGMMLFSSLTNLALLLPNIGISVRRLHDIGKSWKWFLLIFIPILGWIYLIYLYIQPSGGPNEFDTPAAAE
ncbi:MAG: DUF805 domain-containing protein [Chloroflexi bacterium]|nr:MAG: DUF805 domain-containing protein [Chloroflexota bacterium]